MTFDPLLIPVISSFVNSLNSLAFNTIHKHNTYSNRIMTVTNKDQSLCLIFPVMVQQHSKQRNPK